MPNRRSGRRRPDRTPTPRRCERRAWAGFRRSRASPCSTGRSRACISPASRWSIPTAASRTSSSAAAAPHRVSWRVSSRRLAPRGTERRQWLRRAAALYRPARRQIQAAFDRTSPAMVLVASPGHFWLDHFVLDEAAASSHPDRLRRAELGQSLLPRAAVPPTRPSPGLERGDAAAGGRGAPVSRATGSRVVGPLQFLLLCRAAEGGRGRQRCASVSAWALPSRILAYVCGARTARVRRRGCDSDAGAAEAGPLSRSQGSGAPASAGRARGLRVAPETRRASRSARRTLPMQTPVRRRSTPRPSGTWPVC